MAGGRIPERILEEVLGRVDIVELISGYIPLKRAGRNYKAPCPFHQEKTPSFMVSPERQIYHCFGCGAGGNAFGFLMQYERLGFPEAVEALARKAGVVIPQHQREDEKTASLNLQLYKINEAAAEFYVQVLNSVQGRAAKDYLLKRGIKEETIKGFRLGFAPQGWDALIKYLRAKQFNLGLLERAGLVLPKEKGGYYDRFRNRIIFPICDVKERMIAFGARLLPGEQTSDEQAKYINSPETPVYIKGHNLYGLRFSRDALRQADEAIIVEGYLDFLIPYQEGLRNIIASQGTALTNEQVRLIRRYTQNAVMVYDGDKAGEIASLRALDIFIEESMAVKVVSLPEGLDPDSFVRQQGISAFRERITQAQGLFDYKLRILKSRYPAVEAEGKAKIAAEMLPTINKVGNAVLKAEYLKKLSAELAVSEEPLWQELKKLKEPWAYQLAKAPLPLRRTINISAAEKLLIKLMLEENSLLEQMKESIQPSDFLDAGAASIVGHIFAMLKEEKGVCASRLVNRLGDDSVLRVVCESVFLPEVPLEDKEQMMQDCIRRLKDERLKLERQRLQEEIRLAQDSGDEKRLRVLMQDFHNLVKVR